MVVSAVVAVVVQIAPAKVSCGQEARAITATSIESDYIVLISKITTTTPPTTTTAVALLATAGVM